MKTKPIYILYYGLIGANISLISTSITKWGKAVPKTEGITIFICLLCLVITHIIWYKYIRKNEALATNTNKKKLGSLAALWLGILVGVTACSFLLSMSD